MLFHSPDEQNPLTSQTDLNELNRNSALVYLKQRPVDFTKSSYFAQQDDVSGNDATAGRRKLVGGSLVPQV